MQFIELVIKKGDILSKDRYFCAKKNEFKQIFENNRLPFIKIKEIRKKKQQKNKNFEENEIENKKVTEKIKKKLKL